MHPLHPILVALAIASIGPVQRLAVHIGHSPVYRHIGRNTQHAGRQHTGRNTQHARRQHKVIHLDNTPVSRIYYADMTPIAVSDCRQQAIALLEGHYHDCE